MTKMVGEGLLTKFKYMESMAEHGRSIKLVDYDQKLTIKENEIIYSVFLPFMADN